MINSSYNRSRLDTTSFQGNNYAQKQSSVSEIENNETSIKSTKVTYEQQHLNKVEQIKSQIANGSYKMLDSNTLAKKLVDSEFI